MKACRTALLLFALPAVACGLAPALFLYDRAAILHGEWWRLWTGHWVHFSSSHLGWNLAVLLIAGCQLGKKASELLTQYTLVAAPLLSTGLLSFASTMFAYGGLSGLASGIVMLLALDLLSRKQPDRLTGVSLSLLLGAKLVFDATHTNPLFCRFDGMGYQTSALAHALGALLALPFWWWHRSRDNSELMTTPPLISH